MKKIINELMALCPGRLIITIDRHKLFGETAKDIIERSPNEYGVLSNEMIIRDTIIMIEAAPVNKPMPPVIVYHYDLEKALANTLNEIKLWDQTK